MKFYTIEETAEVLKVTPKTIRKWICANRLRASRMANSKIVRVSDEDIKQFYEDNVIESKEEI